MPWAMVVGIILSACVAVKGEGQEVDFTTALIAATMPTAATVLLVNDVGQLWPQPPSYEPNWPPMIYLLQITDQRYPLTITVWDLETVRRCLGQ